MKKTTTRLQVFLSYCIFVVFIGCSTEENSYDIIEEELSVKPDAVNADAAKSSPCDRCSSTIYPGSNNKFKDALQKMDLERRWNGGANESNVSAAHTAAACTVNYFTRCGNWMVMSTDGSKNDRTEVKLPSTYNQSLNNYSQMYYRALVEYIPSSSSSANNKNKGVTIAQIHNRGSSVQRPLARLDIAGYNKKVRVTFAHGYLKSNGQAAYDLVDYDEGDLLRVIMRIHSSGNSVFVYAKNETKNTYKYKTYTIGSNSNWNNKDGSYYYKAGVYQQLPGSAPRISFDRLYLYSL